MLQELPVNKFECIEETSQFKENFIKNYDKESDGRYFLDVVVQHPEKLHELDNDLPLLPGRKKVKKVERIVTKLCDKNEYVIHIRKLKQALNHVLILEKFHRVIKFNQKDWLKPYIDMNTKLRQKPK